MKGERCLIFQSVRPNLKPILFYWVLSERGSKTFEWTIRKIYQRLPQTDCWNSLSQEKWIWTWAPFYIHGYSGYWDRGDISTVMTKPHSDTILPEGLFGSFRILDIFLDMYGYLLNIMDIFDPLWPSPIKLQYSQRDYLDHPSPRYSFYMVFHPLKWFSYLE